MSLYDAMMEMDGRTESSAPTEGEFTEDGGRPHRAAPTDEGCADSDYPAVERDIGVITKEIRFYKQQAGVAVCEIGKRLCEAKAQLSHGEWLGWLEQEVEFSERSAQQYMRLWRGYGKSATVADLGVSKALVLLALPDSEREEFLEEKYMVDGEEKTAAEMTRRELEQAIRERDEARRDAEQKAQDANRQFHAAQDATRRYEELSAEAVGLKKELDELRRRPVEVAVQTVDATEEQLAEARKQAVEKMRGKQKKLEELLADAQKKADAAKKQAETAEAEAEELRKKINMADSSVTVFGERFYRVQAEFGDLKNAFNGIVDAEKKEKLRDAVNDLLDKLKKEVETW